MTIEGIHADRFNPADADNIKERLPFDYKNIRDEAVGMLDQKILSMKAIRQNAPEISQYEAAKKRLGDDSYINRIAKINNWEKLRTRTEDLEKTDENLAKGLMMSSLSLN